MESLRSLVLGGIAFATLDDPKDKPVKNGTLFGLHKTGEGTVGLGTADTDSGELTRYSLWRRRYGRDDADFTWLTELLK
jgi:hypothetical protein